MMSEYESLVEQAKTRTKTASKDYIPKCCEILKKEGLPTEKIVHRIRRDFSTVWSQQTIYEALPEEYKKQTKPKKIQPPESILLEQSSSGTHEVKQEEPEPTPKELEEIAAFNQTVREEVTRPREEPPAPAFVEPIAIPRKHEQCRMSLPFARILNGLGPKGLNRLISDAVRDDKDGIWFKINDQGDLYFP